MGFPAISRDPFLSLNLCRDKATSGVFQKIPHLSLCDSYRLFSGKSFVKKGFSGEELGVRVEVLMKEDEKKYKIFTESELKAFDGRNGSPVYIAYQGKVYDVSGSPLWENGVHVGRHNAGEDLSKLLSNAPHAEDVLIKFPIVGELSQQKTFREILIRRIENFHFHPILVHFSIAYSIGASLLSMLYTLTNERSFETASYYILFLAFLAAPAAGFSGLFSWVVTYEKRMSRTYLRKIVYTIVLITVVTLCFVWRVNDPNVLISKTYLSYIYLGLMISQTPIVIFLGYLGGKITFR
jgi:predicted heme/steroid binding protein/uncharacterized membrane protein